MNEKLRIVSILNAPALASSITGVPHFELSELDVDEPLDFHLPSDLRLGHLVERIVSHLIRASTNYEILFENLQIIENERTIGEIDLIISNTLTKQISHVELAYKFYLYDPGISSSEVENWIGANRNDSLSQKLTKTKSLQLPLLYHEAARAKLEEVDVDAISQKLCLMASLFIPYDYPNHFSPEYQKAIQGCYLSLNAFMDLDHEQKQYYIPPKQAWGMAPCEKDNWQDLSKIHGNIHSSIREKRAIMCWQRHQDTYSSFFIVWW